MMIDFGAGFMLMVASDDGELSPDTSTEVHSTAAHAAARSSSPTGPAVQHEIFRASPKSISALGDAFASRSASAPQSSFFGLTVQLAAM